jgi:hypothetical protein
MEIHIIQVGQKEVALLCKCLPEQQKGGQHKRVISAGVGYGPPLL